MAVKRCFGGARWRPAVVAALGAGWLGVPTGAMGQAGPRVIAYTGQPVDDHRVFAAFDDPLIDETGTILFWGQTSIDTQLNDECAGAIPMSADRVTVGTHFATASASPAWCGRVDVWFSYTYIGATASTAQLLADPASYAVTSNELPAIAVYTGSCAQLTPVGSSCSTPTGVQFPVAPGTTYLIRVGALASSATTALTVTLDLHIGTTGAVDVTRSRTSERGLWAWRDTRLSQLVHDSQATAFDPTLTHRSVYFPVLSTDGWTALTGTVRDAAATPELTHAALMIAAPDQPFTLAQQDAPDSDLENVRWRTPQAQIGPGGRLVYALPDGSEVHYGTSSVTTATAAPGIPPGVNFLFLDPPASSLSGVVAFRSTLAGTDVTDANRSGIWVDRGGGLMMVARAGDAAPATGTAAVFKDFAVEPTVSDAGLVAFAARLAGDSVGPDNDAGVWIATPTETRLVVRTGDPVPGVVAGGAHFVSFVSRPRLTDSGQVIVSASIAGDMVTSSNNTGLWVFTPAGGMLLAIEGEPVTPSSLVLIDSIREPIVHPSGNIDALVTLRGDGVTSGNHEALMVVRGALRRILARTGDRVAAPGMLTRTIRTISAGETGAGLGGAITAADGTIVYRVVFTDGTQAIVASDDRCFADWDRSGAVDSADFFAFLGDFFADRADINNDGMVNSNDFFVFLGLFFAGCP